MGNIVLLAVRHTDLDAVEQMMFKDIEQGYVHRGDGLPKRFDNTESWLTDNDRLFHSMMPNVVASHYYHYDYRVTLYVDGNMLMLLPSFDAVPEHSNEAFDIEQFLPSLRQKYRKDRFSIVNRKGEVSRPAVTGDKVSLFALWTDFLDIPEKNPHIMGDIVHYCRTGEVRRNISSISMGITTIGTLNENQAALVRLHDATVSVRGMPRHDLNIEPAALVQIENHYFRDDWSSAQKLADRAMTREIAAASGYVLRAVVPIKKDA